MVCQRFGIVHFHHPEITVELERFEAYMRLLAMIDSEIFKDDLPNPGKDRRRNSNGD